VSWVRRALLALIGVFLILPLTGCATPAQRFIAQISSANLRLREAGFRFGQEVNRYIHNQGGSPGAIRAARERAAAELSAVKADMKKLEVPNLPQAKSVYDAHQRVLVGQDTIIGYYCRQIVLELEQPTQMADKRHRVQEIIVRMTSREQEDLNRLKGAMESFAKANQVTIQFTQ
jgi:hypothetical protein